MIGRPRKSVALKVLEGTYRADRNLPNAMQPLPGIPEAPPGLTAREAEIFRDLQGLLIDANVHSAGDALMITLLAQRFAEIEVCSILIQDEGRVIRRRGTRGTVLEVVNPAIAQRDSAQRHAQSLLNDLGLSPAARVKVGVNSKPKAPNPFADF